MQQVDGPPAQAPQSPSLFTQSPIVISAFAILTLVSGWGIFLYLGIGSLIGSTSGSKPTPHLDEQQAQATDAETRHQTIALSYRETEQAFVLELQREETRAQLAATRAALEQAEDIADKFQARVETLQTSETGRRLATPDAVRRFRFLAAYPERIEAADVEVAMSELRRPMESTRQPLVNFEELIGRLTKFDSQLESHNLRYQMANAGIDQLLARHPVPQPITLQKAIAQLTSSEAVATQEAVDIRIAEERSHLASQMSEEEDQSITLNEQLQTAEERLAVVKQQARADLEAAEKAIRQSEQQLSSQRAEALAAMQAAYPAVRSLLIPFATPGYRQLSASGRLKITADKLPLSYSGLLRTGALEDTPEGLQTLFEMGQAFDGYSKFNDRPQGTFPPLRDYRDLNKTDIQTKVRQTQAFLREHGAAMVEAGLLSP